MVKIGTITIKTGVLTAKIYENLNGHNNNCDEEHRVTMKLDVPPMAYLTTRLGMLMMKIGITMMNLTMRIGMIIMNRGDNDENGHDSDDDENRHDNNETGNDNDEVFI